MEHTWLNHPLITVTAAAHTQLPAGDHNPEFNSDSPTALATGTVAIFERCEFVPGGVR